LLLSLPVIPLLQFYLGYPLSIVVGSVAAPLLQLAGVAVMREGTCLHWNGQMIAIDAPCSGIKMLWTGFYLVFTLACFYRLNARKTVIAAALALPVIVAGNILRAAGLFYLETGIAKLPVMVSSHLAHESLGAVIFLLTALGLVVLVQSIQRQSFPSRAYAI
jgi:exosortase/archaeosortase family protein